MTARARIKPGRNFPQRRTATPGPFIHLYSSAGGLRRRRRLARVRVRQLDGAVHVQRAEPLQLAAVHVGLGVLALAAGVRRYT